MSSSAVYEVLNGTEPRPANRQRYEALALAHARKRLIEWDIAAPEAPSSAVALYLRERRRQGEVMRRCAWCGEPLAVDARADARYHSGACRKAAARHRVRRS
jgi:hypothetical protein